MVKKVLSLAPVSFSLEVLDVYGRTGAACVAASLAYFLILSLFPLLMCVNYLIGLFHLDLEQFLLSLEQVLPLEALTLMQGYLSYVSEANSIPLLIASLFTLVMSASAALRTLFLTMDDLYRLRRDYSLRRTLLSVALSALFLVTIYLSMVVIFTGDWFFSLLEHHLPEHLSSLLDSMRFLSALWRWLRYLLLFCAILLMVMALYRASVARSVVSDRTVALSALGCAVALVASSILFSWMIDLSSRYALVYGSLASLVILMVWLYFCGNVLLLGAIVSQVACHRRAAKRQLEGPAAPSEA